MNINPRKYKALNIEYPIYFIIAIIILSLSFFVMLSDSFRSNTSEITILFVPKSERTAVQAGYISNNLSLLPKNLSFYEKVLKDNPEIEDKFKGLDKDIRKKSWNRIIETKVENNSTIISIETRDGDKEYTERLSRQIAYSLFDTYSHYYDIETDIDLRIIEGPLTKSETKYFFLLIFISLFLGLIFSLLIFSLIMKNVVKYFNTKLYAKFSPPHFSDIYQKTKPVYDEKEKMETFFPKYEQEKPAGSSTLSKKSFAPSNLPIAENNFPSTPSNLPVMTEKINKIQPESIVENKPNGEEEPTTEEYKKRLNQLLKGEL